MAAPGLDPDDGAAASGVLELGAGDAEADGVTTGLGEGVAVVPTTLTARTRVRTMSIPLLTITSRT